MRALLSIRQRPGSALSEAVVSRSLLPSSRRCGVAAETLGPSLARWMSSNSTHATPSSSAIKNHKADHPPLHSFSEGAAASSIKKPASEWSRGIHAVADDTAPSAGPASSPDAGSSSPSSAPPPPLAYRVPTLSSRVVGRQNELLRLWQQLLSGKRLQILTGVDGIGKSTIAAEFCDRARRSGRFSCVQWCHGGRHAVASQLQKLFEEMRGRQELDVLLVVDGVLDLATVVRILPKHPQLYVVLTTTAACDMLPADAGAVVIPVAPLLPEDALEFRSRHQSAEEEAFRALAQYCEHVPLLLQLAVPLIEERGMTAEAVLQHLQQSDARQGDALSVSKAVAALLPLSIQAVTEACASASSSSSSSTSVSTSTSASSALARLACLHLGDLSDAVLAAVVGDALAASFSAAAARYGLLSLKWESSAYSMHQTLADVLRRNVSHEELIHIAECIGGLWPRRWREMISSKAYALVWHSYSLLDQFQCSKLPLTPALVHALDRGAMFLAHYGRQDLPLAAEMWYAIYDYYNHPDKPQRPNRDAVRVGRECGRLLHFLRDPRANAVLSRTAEWCRMVHGDLSVEHALVLSCLAPYLEASAAHVQLLETGIAAVDQGLRSTETVLRTEESRMLKETKFVLLLRKGQVLQELGQRVPEALWTTLDALEAELTAKKK